jgi:phage baseplate assembly protein gpV
MAGGPGSEDGQHDLGGVYYAIVTQNDDKDGPGGRVKVRYPWLSDGERDQSFWAPMAAPMIGAGFGTYTLPDVNDEVLVMFLSGDIHHPIVVGGGWSQKDRPPETNQDGKNDFRLIKSRARHRLIFDDTSNTKVVLTDLGDKHMIDVGAHGKQGSSPNAIEVPALGSGQGVSVAAASGSLNIWCPDGTLKIKARDVEVSAKEGADVRGSQFNLRGTEGATISATGGGKFQGAPLKLGGG